MAGDKYLYNNAGTTTEKAAIQSSAGAGDAGKIPALDAAGRVHVSMMPVGTDVAVGSVVASENLAAGDFVNIHNSTGAKVRKADATTSGKEAHGFVLSAVTAPAAALVYFEGTNTGLTGLTPGPQFLSDTAGLAQATAPSGTGKVVQRLGVATSATDVQFEASDPIVLA